MIPPSLQTGDTIGVMAPSSKVDRSVVDAARDALEKRGFKVKIHPQTYAVDRQSAGLPQEKLAAFHDLCSDPGVKAIFAARGGNRAGYLLNGLDYGLIKKNPKIILGFSDVTAILNAINGHTGLVTFHGPVLSKFAKGLEDDDLRQCFNLLAGTEAALPMQGARIAGAGVAEGRLVGGNLSLVSSLVGTPYLPDMDRAILFLEDCDDEISRFDRMLLHLRNAGVLDRIAGLVFGQFTNVQDTGPNFFGFTMNDLMDHIVKSYKIPVVCEAPFGHGRALATYPVGALARLDASGKLPTLTLTGPVVS